VIPFFLCHPVCTSHHLIWSKRCVEISHELFRTMICKSGGVSYSFSFIVYSFYFFNPHCGNVPSLFSMMLKCWLWCNVRKTSILRSSQGVQERRRLPHDPMVGLKATLEFLEDEKLAATVINEALQKVRLIISGVLCQHCVDSFLVDYFFIWKECKIHKEDTEQIM